MVESSKNALRRALSGEERLWRVWLVCGFPVAVIACVMTGTAETARIAGAHTWGDLLDVAKLLTYFFWFRLAWRCSRNVDAGIWTPVSHFAASTGLLLMVLI